MPDRPKTSKRRRPRPIGVAILLICLAFLITAIVGIALRKPENNPIVITGASEVQRLIGGLPQEGNRLGQSNAPVTIEVYNDLQCLSCRQWQLNVVPPLINGPVRDGDAKIIFRHFSQSQRVMTAAAVASVAAGWQGRQWQYLEMFFINQGQARDRGVTNALLTDIARGSAVAFDLEAWNKARKSKAVKDAIIRDLTLSEDRKLPTGPAVVVDGPYGTRTLIQGPTLEQVQRAISAVG